MTNKEKYSKKLIDIITNSLLSKKIRKTDEKCNFCIGCSYDGTPCEKRIEKWLLQEAEMTANDMFEKLGYELVCSKENIIEYYNKNEDYYIVISTNLQYGKYSNCNDDAVIFITEEENKAIMKKLEELKKEIK